MENIFQISGFTCQACVQLAKRRLVNIPGVSQVDVNIDGQAKLISPSQIEKSQIEAALSGTDYKLL